MDMTFGIIVGPGADYKTIKSLVDSILTGCNDMEYRIVLIGGSEAAKDVVKLYGRPDIEWINFDEQAKSGWITRKKNIIVEKYQSDWFCLVHDYYFFQKDFSKTFQRSLQADPNVLQIKTQTLEGFKHSDWVIDPRVVQQYMSSDSQAFDRLRLMADPGQDPKYVCGLPYGCRDLTHLQYISGGIICARDYVLRSVPQNENMVWGQAEDLEWTDRLRLIQPRIRLTDHVGVTLQKPGKWAVEDLPWKAIEDLREDFGDCKWQKNRYPTNV